MRNSHRRVTNHGAVFSILTTRFLEIAATRDKLPAYSHYRQPNVRWLSPVNRPLDTRSIPPWIKTISVAIRGAITATTITETKWNGPRLEPCDEVIRLSNCEKLLRSPQFRGPMKIQLSHRLLWRGKIAHHSSSPPVISKATYSYRTFTLVGRRRHIRKRSVTYLPNARRS